MRIAEEPEERGKNESIRYDGPREPEQRCESENRRWDGKKGRIETVQSESRGGCEIIRGNVWERVKRRWYELKPGDERLSERFYRGETPESYDLGGGSC